MGERGPIPKRADQRRRRNQPAGGPVVSVDMPAAAPIEAPKANSRWHPVAKRWFEALAASGQSVFYEPSDWATAYLVAESMSRELRPHPVGVTKDGTVVMAETPLRGAVLSAWRAAMATLLVTEGDRRRALIEIRRAPAEEETDVSELTEYRRRLRGRLLETDFPSGPAR